MTNRPVIIIGNGGHAGVLTEILIQQNRTIIGFTAPEKQGNRFGISYLGSDEIINTYDCEEIELILGIGSVNVTEIRAIKFKEFKEKGFNFATVIHESSIISPSAILGEGVHVMAGSVIQSFVNISDNTIINTSSSIDHDSYIGKHSHIAPGAILSGGVKVGELSHIGAGSIIIQNIQIGSHVMVRAGVLVKQHVPDHSKI
ncbi:acetyltransferase [Lederbergia wuyishanensis]|uniref:UDP-perosamine 4-acetyltransferase n=1 Tax=Lederbergia wuyishanensis TaxID=1347903 RepID=A0ABU0D8S5_9BACI|nr:acetyltransferase [Lederbergia wuyishanensis]MCJ8007607.1 acetyltransferase [Lederbergia wuyishanensis]MDQ0344809.1 UDP-perosamine 4-acetyltransferase [Lederbergia wuyishanensis]